MTSIHARLKQCYGIPTIPTAFIKLYSVILGVSNTHYGALLHIQQLLLKFEMRYIL